MIGLRIPADEPDDVRPAGEGRHRANEVRAFLLAEVEPRQVGRWVHRTPVFVHRKRVVDDGEVDTWKLARHDRRILAGQEADGDDEIGALLRQPAQGIEPLCPLAAVGEFHCRLPA